MKKAILSVSNKSGIVEFAKSLIKLDYELYSTGGTKGALKDASVPVKKSVSELTQFLKLWMAVLKHYTRQYMVAF